MLKAVQCYHGELDSIPESGTSSCAILGKSHRQESGTAAEQVQLASSRLPNWLYCLTGWKIQQPLSQAQKQQL